MTNSPLTNLKEVIDPRLTFLPLVAPSLSPTLRDTTEGVLRLLSSPLPLAQYTGLQIDKSLRGDASYVEDD